MDYIRTNKLKAALGSTGKDPSQIRYGSSKIYRLYYGNSIVWDVLRTTFSASNFSIGASGGDVASNSSVTSYGINALGTKESLGWTCSPTTISANSSTSSKTHTIKYTQSGTGDTTTATCTQAASAVVNWTVSASASVGTAPASGGWMSVTISWTLYKNGDYYTSGTSTPTSVYMDYSYQSASQVYVPSAGTTFYSSAHVVGYITSYSFSADGHSFDVNDYYAVYRAANTSSRSWGAYTLSISSSKSSFTSSASTATITVGLTRAYTDTWTSGATESGTTSVSDTVTLSTTYGTLSSSSVAGNGSVTLSVDNDYGNGYTATVTAKVSSTSKSVSIPQAKRVESSTGYSTPSISNAYQNENIPAWGGTAYLMIAWSQTKTITYDNSTTSSSTVTGTSQAVITSGTVQQTGASLRSDGGIYKTSCGTEVTVQRTVYTVTSYYFTANGVKREVSSTTFNIGQAPNSVTGTSWLGTYNLSISHSLTGNMSNAGGTTTISVNCTENGTITYTSTATAATTRNATASLTTTAGTLSTSSITGGGTSTLTVNENTGAQRTITVTANVGSTSKTTSFVQNAVEWVFTATTKTFNVAYNATSQQISGTSSMNGSWAEIKKSDISVTGGELSGVVTNSGTTFYATITFDENTTNSPRTITVVVTQSRGNSSETITYTITQAAKPAETVWIKWLENSGKWVGGAKFTFSATLLYNKSLYGKNATVNITPMKGGTAITSATSVTLTGTSMYGDMYVQDISLLVQTSDDGSAFSLRAVYGTTTADIELDKSSELL